MKSVKQLLAQDGALPSTKGVPLEEEIQERASLQNLIGWLPYAKKMPAEGVFKKEILSLNL